MRSLKNIPVDVISIAPSLLAADFANLASEIIDAENAGADLLHLDVMDGHFVPNLTIGPPLIKSLRKHSTLLFDAHLMITDPLKYISSFVKAGVDHITFHIESNGDPVEIINEIKRHNITVGISVKPKTQAKDIFPYLSLLDMVLVMTVEPGFGGQSFMSGMMPKLKQIREEINIIGKHIHLQVDGGINAETIIPAFQNGANNFVAGTSVFGNSKGIKDAISELKNQNRQFK